MTNPSEAWKLLTARGVQLGRPGGGQPALTATDVAQMLKDLARGAYLTALVTECGDIRSLPELERHLFLATLWLADPFDGWGRLIMSEQWPFTHGQAYGRRLVGLAVYEFAMPRPEKCGGCHGRGWTQHEGNGIQCTTCMGTGGEKLSPHAKVQLAGIPYTSWTTGGWSRRYEQVFEVIRYWHADANAHLRRGTNAMRESA